MLIKPIFFLFFFLFLLLKQTDSSEADFTFNGFSTGKLTVDGIASVTPDGLLMLNNSTQNSKGHAIYPLPLRFKASAGKVSSFSTTFVFAILSEVRNLSGQGITFFVSGTTNFSNPAASQYMGILSETNNGNSSNHIFAVELDTIQNPEFRDIDDNHVGIDINSMNSNDSHPAGYYDDATGLFNNLTLISGEPMQVWIDFNGETMRLNVTLCPLQIPKPSKPLLSSVVDLASLMLDSMHIGFSTSNGPFRTRHYILGWSFKLNGSARPLDYAQLPSLPHTKSNRQSVLLVTLLSTALCLLLLLAVVAALLILRRRIKYAEVFEDWERDYALHRFSYKDLYQATNRFSEEELLGSGGFGRVYRGVMPTSNTVIAVKKVSHGSKQGMREFVAEIASIGRLCHRNLIQLLGYCRRERELLLVYDFVPNGSLDKFLYGSNKPSLNWVQRFQIVKGVASGLLYLHADWEQVVVHRDVKASNVLLDEEFNGKLGDFGLARLYDRGSDPQTTRVVGTMGYIAPELSMTGKATTMSDVFAFGVFLLEVVCGRRPISPISAGEDLILVDWVQESWRRGLLMEAVDQRLREDYSPLEAERVLKLGLLCAHPVPASRPSMRQVVHILDGVAELPDLPPISMGYSTISLYQSLGFDNYVASLTSSEATTPVLHMEDDYTFSV